MPEWNQSPGGSPPALGDILEKIRLKLEGFKGAPFLILGAVAVVVIILWTAWFTVQPEETGIVQRFGMEKELRQIRSAAYRTVQEIQGQADADATRIYGKAYNRNPEFYSFLRTLESYKEKTNENSVMILTTDSDFYQYIKQAVPDEAQSLSAPVSRGAAQ